MLPQKYVVRCDNLDQEREVASIVKEEPWIGDTFHGCVLWDKDKKGSILGMDHRAENWPVYTYAEWKKLYYMTQLPLKWRVQRTFTNHEAINKVMNSIITPGGDYSASSGYIYSEPVNNSGNPLASTNGDGLVDTTQFKDITFDEFISHFTGRVKIGYIVPIDMWGGTVPKGSVYVKDPGDSFYYLRGKSRSHSQSMPGEVVETWLPMYTDTDVKVQLGVPLRDFFVRAELVTMVDAAGSKRVFNKREVIDIARLFNPKPHSNSFEYKPVSIQFGCSDGTQLTAEDIAILINEMEKL